MIGKLFSKLAEKAFDEVSTGECSNQIQMQGASFKHVFGALWKPHPFEKKGHPAKLYYCVDEPGHRPKYLKIL